MRDWLLVETGLDKISDLKQADMRVFRSGDGARPEPGDLQRAVDALCEGADVLSDRPIAVVLIPLDEAHVMDVSLSQRWGINNMAELDLGPNVD